MADKIKLVFALLLVVASLIAFYYFAEQSQLYRVLGLIGALIVATLISLQTEVGRNTRDYFRGSIVEVRKVVWPTRKETTQTTLIVFFMVFIMGLLLWLFDMLLVWAVQILTGQGG